MAWFLATEVALFGTLVSSYFYLRTQADAWPPPGVAKPDLLAPLLLTGLLVATTVPVWLAARAAGAGRARTAQLFLLAALAGQAAYFALQVVLYARDLDAFAPEDSAYGSIYFTLVGAHHAHVFVGMLLSLWLVVRLVSGLTPYRAAGVSAVALYWYVVSALSVAVVLTQVSPSL
jgi:heme/copper-type cytochrome/quinol oxidase subunit 3